MPTRCVVGGCSNNPDLENGIALHCIPYFGDDRPQAKKDEKSGCTALIVDGVENRDKVYLFIHLFIYLQHTKRKKIGK